MFRDVVCAFSVLEGGQVKTLNHGYYLFIIGSAVTLPLLFAFCNLLDFKVAAKRALFAISIIAPFFLVWDILYTSLEVWGFNSNYHYGITFLKLPLEEILFFVFIPFCCLFTYHAVARYVQKEAKLWSRLVLTGLGILMLLVAIASWELRYTSVVSGTSAVVFLFAAWKNPRFLKRFVYTYIILSLPFLAVNGALTGTFSDAPVVWYTATDITGIRVFTIPIEDFIYSGLMIFLNVAVFEGLSGFDWKRDKVLGLVAGKVYRNTGPV